MNGDLPSSVKTPIQTLMFCFEKCSPDSCGNMMFLLSAEEERVVDELTNIR